MSPAAAPQPQGHPQRAVQGFLPFCIAVLQGRVPRAGVGRLPLHRPEALTAEVVAAIQDMTGKAVYRWLFADLGWEVRTTVHPTDPEETVSGRLWEPALWGELRLHFTEETVDALLMAWNLHALPDEADLEAQLQRPQGRRWARMDAEARRQWVLEARQEAGRRFVAQDIAALASLKGQASGDLLLGHRLSLPLLERATPEEIAGWSRNPLTRMVAMEVAQTTTGEGLERLLAPDVRPLLPWIGGAWPRQWQARARRRPATRERLRLAWSQQATLWDAWMTSVVAVERLDLLAPLLEGYRDQLATLEADTALLARLSQGTRVQERQELQRAWADAWLPLLRLQGLAQETRRLHPIDRAAHHRLFLSAAAALDLGQLAARGEALVRTLHATIG